MRAGPLTGCPRCGSPFVTACTADGWARCRSCPTWIALRAGQVVAGVPGGSATTTEVAAGLPEGTVLVRRWSPRGQTCAHLAVARELAGAVA